MHLVFESLAVVAGQERADGYLIVDGEEARWMRS